MNINLHIERLVLDGIAVEPYQRAVLKAAVESELSRLLISNGIDAGAQTGKSSRAVSGGLISIENTHKPTRIGQQIGDAVYRGIGK